MKLSILIPALVERWEMRKKLVRELYRQIESTTEQVEVIVCEDRGDITVGTKCQFLMQDAKGEYCCVVDDDDWVSGNYLSEILLALRENPDVVTFNLYRVDLAERWIFGTKYEDRQQLPDVHDGFGMSANQLCVWKRSIASSIPWPDSNSGSDVIWYRRLREVYPNPVEIHIPKILYLYFYDPQLTRSQKVP